MHDDGSEPRSRGALSLGIALLGSALAACVDVDSGGMLEPIALEQASALGEVDPGHVGWFVAPAFSSRLRVDGGSVWVDIVLPAGAWTRATEGYSVVSPVRIPPTRLASGDLRLSLGGSDLVVGVTPEAPLTIDRGRLRFAVDGVDPSGVPDATLSMRLPRGQYVDGEWRSRVGNVTANAITAWPGERRRIEIPRGGERRLAFATVAATYRGEASPACRFRIELEGEELFAHAARPASPEVIEWHEVVVPPTADAAELVFSVEEAEGVGVQSAFLAPRLRSVAEAAPVDRRPDIVLFLADTFRADNLAAWGGDPALAPQLNAFVACARRYERTWSPASWTLPSQASMLTATYPEQHGAISRERGVPETLVSLAEQLRASGYRTGAVTDALYVSESYGFDRGFEVFQEFRSWNLERTLRAADAFLEADDGRPAFLFVQTYRTHTPYRSGVDESRAAYEGFLAEASAGSRRLGGDGSLSDASAARRFRELYLEGVRGLDAVVGPWLARLEARGFFDRGLLAFTSDHGEAFHEHGSLGHGGFHWEERIRVPLAIRGAGLEPGSIATPMTLVDLPRTLCALAGVSPHAAWEGRAVLAGEPERVVFTTTEGSADGALRRMTLHRSSWKLCGSLDAGSATPVRVEAMFDLASDPGERSNVLSAHGTLAARLIEDHRDEIVRIFEPLVASGVAVLTREQAAALDAIGY